VKKDMEGCKNVVKLFNEHYRKFYSVNDFSLNSLTQKSNPEDVAEISAMLDVVKTINKK
jgi:hypothetical protein